MSPTVIVALLGVASAVVAATVNGALATRSKTGEDVRAGRLEAYPAVWELTRHVSRWPKRELTRRAALQWHLAMREWYYTAPRCGGMYLSENGRARYGDVQELLALYLSAADAGEEAFPSDVYEALSDACSAFRTALTEDLQSRRARSLIWVLSRARLHRRHAAEGRRRIDRARSVLQVPPSSTGPDGGG
ncbi:hypothetical protein [Streptomyces sp. NPDC000888]